MADVSIDGDRLRAALKHLGIKQNVLASRIDVTKYTVSRWCAKGSRPIQNKHAKAIAKVLGIKLDEMIRQCGAHSGKGPLLNHSEIEWLELYQRLKPLDQARVRIAVDKIIKKMR